MNWAADADLIDGWEINMAAKGRDPIIVAVEAIYAALKDLDEPDRAKALSSVYPLLELGRTPIPNPAAPQPVAEVRHSASVSLRPVSLTELINDKKPGTSAQRIALFAYYREKVEGQPRFGRDDPKPYFGTAKITPATNYDRDFVEAVRKGWIHEDGSDSYLTTKGVEAIETDFEGERKYLKARKPPTTRKKKASQAKRKRK